MGTVASRMVTQGEGGSAEEQLLAQQQRTNLLLQTIAVQNEEICLHLEAVSSLADTWEVFPASAQPSFILKVLFLAGASTLQLLSNLEPRRDACPFR